MSKEAKARIKIDVLINMLDRFAIELKKSLAPRELYDRFRPRLLTMNRAAEIGWGYGDFIHETFDELEEILGDKKTRWRFTSPDAPQCDAAPDNQIYAQKNSNLPGVTIHAR